MADDLRRQRQTAEEAFMASLGQLRTVLNADAPIATQIDNSQHSSPAKGLHSSEAPNDMDETLAADFESAAADIEAFMQNSHRVEPPSS